MFKPFPPIFHCPQFVMDALGSSLLNAQPVGSRVTCDPPPLDTDEDWLVLVSADPQKQLESVGFTQDGQAEFYTDTDEGGFRSWRLGDINVVTTQDYVFYDLFITATGLAKQFNLLDKQDRIALFQAVLYGARTRLRATRAAQAEREWSGVEAQAIEQSEDIFP